MRKATPKANPSQDPKISYIKTYREPAKKGEKTSEIAPNVEESSYKFYSFISRLPFPISFSWKIMLLILVGTCLPMLGTVLYLTAIDRHPLGARTTNHVLFITLAITGMGFIYYSLNSLLAPLKLVSRNLREYVNFKKLPNLPTHFTDELGGLMKNVQHTLCIIDDLIESLEKASVTDYLTGAYNRHSGEKRLKEDISRAQRNGGAISLVMLDIDDFKSINDRYGHDTGDVCIKHLVSTIKSNIREGDLLARWGGDEFMLTLFDSDLECSGKILQRICHIIREHPSLTCHGEIPLTLSVGICEYNGEDDGDSFFRKADRALLAAKRLGKSQVVYYPDCVAQVSHRLVV